MLLYGLKAAYNQSKTVKLLKPKQALTPLDVLKKYLKQNILNIKTHATLNLIPESNL